MPLASPSDGSRDYDLGQTPGIKEYTLRGETAIPLVRNLLKQNINLADVRDEGLLKQLPDDLVKKVLSKNNGPARPGPESLEHVRHVAYDSWLWR